MNFLLKASLIGNLMHAKGTHSFGLLLENTRDTLPVAESGSAVSLLYPLFEFIAYIFGKLIYTISKFVLNIIDLFQMLAYKLIGIGNPESFEPLSTDNILFRFVANNAVINVFIALLAIAIILVILFVIIAIIRTEYKNATGEDTTGAKARIAKRSLKAVGAMILFPSILLFSVFFINAILGSLLGAFNNTSATTVGSSIFISSAYDANNYRNYANSNARIPILINFEDPELYVVGTASDYDTESLAKIYESWEETGEDIFRRFAYNDFETFSSTLYYKNNVIMNNNKFSGFEKFVCTPEQYQVMADFIDYAMVNGLEFYIKAYDDDDVDWKYVDTAYYDSVNNTFKINYVNSTNKIGQNSTYNIIYKATSFSFDSPIQTAIETLNEVLSIGEYKDYKFKLLDRISDSENLVSFKTDKLQVKLSDNYDSSPTPADQLILYEYYRNQKNNTFKNYSIADLTEGRALLDVKEIHYTRYSFVLQKYLEYATQKVVYINGSYYAVKEYEKIENNKKVVYYDFDDEILTSELTYLNGL
ncbi:MAG: hypothetical protein IJT25_02835, partial [Clostridia bacterium]|nr:hypothetical protein [Clostridia bacterium]